MAGIPTIHPVATIAHRQLSAAIAAELRIPAAAATESVHALAAGATPQECGRARRSTRCAAPILSLTALLAAEGAPLALARVTARVPAALRLLRAPPRILQAAAAAAQNPKFGLSCGRSTRATGRRTGRSGGDRRNAHGAAAAWWRPRRLPRAADYWRSRWRPDGAALLPGDGERLLRKKPKRVGGVGTQGVACNCCCAGRSTRLLQPRQHTADILQLGLGPRPSSDHRSSRCRRPEAAKVDPGPAAKLPGRSTPG